MQGKGGGWSWLRMLNKQFFLTTNLGTCSHHVMARDDLLSTKHDQAISGAVSVYLNSNGGSLSICLLLKSKRSIGLCIFSLMNSLFPIFFFFLPFSGQSFPKTPSDCFCFFPLYEFFFSSLFLCRCQKMSHWLICFKRHFSIRLDLCISDSKQSWHLAYLFIYVEQKTCSCLTSFN